MKIDAHYVRLFFLILLSSAFVFGVAKAGVLTYESVFAEDDRFTEHTLIGPVSVEGLGISETRDKLQSEIMNWQSSDKVTVSYGEINVEIPPQSIQFLIEESIISAENSNNNPLLVEVDTKQLSGVLSDSFPEKIVSAINMESLKTEIANKANLLEDDEQNILLVHNLNPDSGISEGVLSEATMSTSYMSDLKEPYTFQIEPNRSFTFLTDFASQYPAWSNEMLTKVASVMYKASLSTNLKIIERHISTVKPANIELGFESNINKYDDIDLVLKNPNDFPLTFTVQSKENGELIVGIQGFPLNNQYQIRKSNIQYHDFRTIIQYSPKLEFKEEVINQNGVNGASVTVYRDILNLGGKKVNTETISEDSYLPVNKVVEKSVLMEELKRAIVEAFSR